MIYPSEKVAPNSLLDGFTRSLRSKVIEAVASIGILVSMPAGCRPSEGPTGGFPVTSTAGTTEAGATAISDSTSGVDENGGVDVTGIPTGSGEGGGDSTTGEAEPCVPLLMECRAKAYTVYLDPNPDPESGTKEAMEINGNPLPIVCVSEDISHAMGGAIHAEVDTVCTYNPNVDLTDITHPVVADLMEKCLANCENLQPSDLGVEDPIPANSGGYYTYSHTLCTLITEPSPYDNQVTGSCDFPESPPPHAVPALNSTGETIPCGEECFPTIQKDTNCADYLPQFHVHEAHTETPSEKEVWIDRPFLIEFLNQNLLCEPKVYDFGDPKIVGDEQFDATTERSLMHELGFQKGDRVITLRSWDPNAETCEFEMPEMEVDTPLQGVDAFMALGSQMQSINGIQVEFERNGEPKTLNIKVFNPIKDNLAEEEIH